MSESEEQAIRLEGDSFSMLDALSLLFAGKPPAVLETVGNDGADRTAWAGTRVSLLLLHGEATNAASGADLSKQLSVCYGLLAEGGHIAVLARNRAGVAWGLLRRFLDRLWRPVPQSSPDRHTLSLSRSEMFRRIQAAGFDGIEVFAVEPSFDHPETIRPADPRYDWLAPALLFVAGKRADSSDIVLRKGLRKALLEGADSTLERLHISTRGKAIAFVKGGNHPSVVRIALSPAMLEDERRSYAILEQLQANPAVADLVPAPLGSTSIDSIEFFAQSRLSGVPIATRIGATDRTRFLLCVEAFLQELNPGLEAEPTLPIDDTVGPAVGGPMIEFVLRHIADPDLRAASRVLVEQSLRGASGRRGVVHGDFGCTNILVDEHRITGIIDWEAARTGAPPVLDALNYLDSVHRCCNPGISMVDSLPLLADGRWPQLAEAEFLDRAFVRSGVDVSFRKGLVLLYFCFHIGPQLRFAAREPEVLPRLNRVMRRFVESEGYCR